MTDDNPSIPNSNSTVGTDTDGGHEVDGNALINELKSENSALKATVQVLQTEKQQFVEKEKQYEKENAELKIKNQTLTEENKAFEEKLKKLEEMIQMNQQNLSQIENQSMVPIREMKVQLPLENWHDILTLVPRSQLGNVVSEIGHYQFAYIIQSFLHDPVKKITLGEMHIIPPRWHVGTDRTMVRVWPNESTNMPDWPMPGNVKNFVGIHFEHVDMSVLNFLQKFQQNSLLDNVNLGLGHYGRYPSRDIPDLIQIVPLVNSIDSVNCQDFDLLKMVYSDNNNNDGHMTDESTQLLLKMMTMTRILAVRLHDWECQWRDKIDWCFSWLYTPREDGRPRMLISHCFIEDLDFPYLIERFQKDFEMAYHSVSYFIRIRIQDNDNVQPDYISFDNAKTNEKLVIKTKIDGHSKKLLISRYPLNAAKNWIEANENEISEWNRGKLDRKIHMNLDWLVDDDGNMPT